MMNNRIHTYTHILVNKKFSHIHVHHCCGTLLETNKKHDAKLRNEI